MGESARLGLEQSGQESGDFQSGSRFQRQNGADVDRKTRDIIARIPEDEVPKAPFRGRLNGAGAALATTDGRWALVSTSLTALVAGAIAWMAVGMMPVTRPMVAPGRASLPYALFMKLIRASEPQGPVQNDNADNANPNPGVEQRTVTLDAGDTLAGMLEDVGISSQDANAVVSAMGRNFSPRQLKAGQSFDLTYSVSTIDATGNAASQGVPKTTVVMVNHKPVIVPVNAEDDDSNARAENS